MINGAEQAISEELDDQVVNEVPEQDNEPKEPVSLRETIKNARETSRERDETGKFTRSTHKTDEKEPSKEEKAQKVVNKPNVADKNAVSPAQPEIVPPPNSLSGHLKSKWNELPHDVRQEIAKREADFHKELTKHDEERNFGRQIEKIVTPYVAQIRLEGATVPQAVESLLNMAHLLRVGTPQQKSELLLRTAKAYGVDLRQAMQQAQQPVNPQIDALQRQVQMLNQKLQQDEANKKQQEESSIQGQIEAFKSDPKHPHFETVKAHMAALLKSGLAQDLEDAYGQAVYANPNTRSTLLSPPVPQGDNRQRVAERQVRVDAARKAGSSIKGSPGATAPKNGKIVMPDLRSEIKAAFAAHNEG